MSDNTGIEWTNATWNPVTGCSKVIQGCKNCYADRVWNRLSKIPGTVYFGREFTNVACHTGRLDQPLRWTRPRMIFVNSMSDLFHDDVPDAFIADVFDVMVEAKQHIFQILTKRPERMLDFMVGLSVLGANPKPTSNVWLGVSIEDQATADERIPLLLDTPAAIRWISAEPLLGPIDLTTRMQWLKQFNTPPNINWVVVGGESGQKARPMHPSWARSLRNQCQEAGVPFFMKQLSEFDTKKFKEFSAFPADLRVREYPL